MPLETRRLLAYSGTRPTAQRPRGSAPFVQYSALPSESQTRQAEKYHDHPQQAETDGHGGHRAAPESKPCGRRQAGTMPHNILRLCRMTNSTPPATRPSIVIRKSAAARVVSKANPKSSANTPLRTTKVQLKRCFKIL